jgi:hypothetical protein
MRRIGLPVLFFFLCFVSTGWRQAEAQTKSRVITFDVPDAGTNPQQGTLPAQVTDSGLTGRILCRRQRCESRLRARPRQQDYNLRCARRRHGRQRWRAFYNL